MTAAATGPCRRSEELNTTPHGFRDRVLNTEALARCKLNDRLALSRRRSLAPRQQTAFTPIVILVVVAILALLMAVLLPSLQQAHTQAKVGVCKANRKQITIAFCQYPAENSEYVPVVFNYFANGMCDPFSVRLEDRTGRTTTVIVDGFTGEVSVEEGR